MRFAAPRGTQDVLPDRAPLWVWVEEKFRRIARLYGYGEIRTPMFEHTQLFARTSGDSSDIVSKEMYTFQDRGDDSLTLRPAGTASVVRAYVEHGISATQTLAKLYYIAPMFRYDRPQAGRFRQHHQAGIEAIGTDDPAIDAEVIGLGRHYLGDLGVTGAVIYI